MSGQPAVLLRTDRPTVALAVLRETVFETEPLPAHHPLWGYENLAITPRCASIYDGWDVKSVQMFAAKLVRYRRGEALENVVDPERGY